MIAGVYLKTEGTLRMRGWHIVSKALSYPTDEMARVSCEMKFPKDLVLFVHRQEATAGNDDLELISILMEDELMHLGDVVFDELIESK